LGLQYLEIDASDPVHVIEQIDAFDALVITARLATEVEFSLLNAVVSAWQGQARTLISTSGTGVVSIRARLGEWDQNVFAEGEPFPFPELGVRRARLASETLVLGAGGDGLRSMVIRLPQIWGLAGSDHIPAFFDSARQFGKIPYLGSGLNVISNVHVEDAAALYSLLLDRGTGGALYHAVAGEVAFRPIAEAVAEVTGLPAESMPLEPLGDLLGRPWVMAALAVNSRTQAVRSRSELGWTPVHTDLIDDIRQGSYREAFEAGKWQ
jgi:nucleoside-diphosphate-sugar epimerase